MFIPNFMFYTLPLLFGGFFIAPGLRALRTGEFYGSMQQHESGVKFLTETLIVLFGGIYLFF